MLESEMWILWHSVQKHVNSLIVQNKVDPSFYHTTYSYTNQYLDPVAICILIFSYL